MKFKDLGSTKSEAQLQREEREKQQMLKDMEDQERHRARRQKYLAEKNEREAQL